MQLNRICSDNVFFDQRCNELEHWLHERKYSERVLRQEILKARLYTHYIQDDHEGKNDWQFTIIDHCTTNAELRKREVY